MEKVTKAEAIECGLWYYWSERPCKKYGHIGFRRVDAGSCYECGKADCRKWSAANKEYEREKNKRFKDNNPDYWNEYGKKNPEVGARAAKRYRQKFPEKHVAEVSRYQKKYPEKIRAYSKKRRQDPAKRIRANLASRLAMAIRNALGNKSANTMKLVGCTISELMNYLENKFLPGMTWENYGLGSNKWHIDHITPCSSFDLTEPEQQRKCFHHTNLQPLWQPDNLRKGNRELGHVVTV